MNFIMLAEFVLVLVCPVWGVVFGLGILPFLKDISLDVEHGKLITIIGKVGCGKSALLKAMLGEMNILSERNHLL